MKLYNGKVDLQFAAASHRYKINGKAVKGVTTILGSVIPKEGLIPWAAGLSADTLAQSITAHFAGEGLWADFDIKGAVLLAKRSHTAKKDAGADVGTKVHKWIELWIGGDPQELPDDPLVANGVKAFLDWVAASNVQFVDSERVVYSKLFDYCGTYDATAKINGLDYLIDFKTSEPKRGYNPTTKRYTGEVEPYPEAFLQLGAYHFALQEETDRDFDRHLVVYITKKGEFFTFELADVELNIAAWLNALAHARSLDKIKQLTKHKSYAKFKVT